MFGEGKKKRNLIGMFMDEKKRKANETEFGCMDRQ